MKEGSRREVAAGCLIWLTRVCHFRSAGKCPPANCLPGDWKSDTRVLCEWYRKARGAHGAGQLCPAWGSQNQLDLGSL